MHFSSRAALVALLTFVLFTISSAVQAQAVWQAGTGSEFGNAYFGGNVGIGAWPSTFPLNVQKTGQGVGGSTSAYLLAAFGSPNGNQGTFIGYDAGSTGTSSIGIVGSTGYSSSLAFWTGNGGTGSLERMRLTSAGEFLLGTTSPTGFVTIEKTQDAMTSAFIRNYSTGSETRTSANARYVAQTEAGATTLEQMSAAYTDAGARQHSGGALISTGTSGLAIATTGSTSDTFSGSIRFYTAGVGNERMRINKGGQVGIGTSDPQATFHVSAGGARGLFQDTTAGTMIRIIPGSAAYGLIDATSSDQNSTRNLVMQPNGGFVGIGFQMTTPTVPLDVIGDIHSSGNIAAASITTAGVVNSTSYSAAGAGGMSVSAPSGAIRFYAGSASEAMRVNSDGKVGIGISASLGAALHVRTASGAAAIFEGAAAATGVRITPVPAAAPYAVIEAYDTVSTGTRNLLLQSSGGNVGIGLTGATVPSARLDVNGDINVSGNINAKYQDVAEWVVTAEPLTAGTVVVLSRELSNVVTASTEAYDTTVAGVVSAQPGITLGERADNKAKIATTGRVKVHVDASSGPIAIGDLLVTSGQRGTAMKSQVVDLGGLKIHRPGTIVGKALEPLASGEGEILVLLTLQ